MALEYLDRLGLGAWAEHYPNELSGGQKQRVAIARALITSPRIILADEPTGSLDSQNRIELQQLFMRLRDELHHTFVIVTHDEALSANADRVLHISDGRIIDC